jgi:hypothetical protein
MVRMPTGSVTGSRQEEETRSAHLTVPSPLAEASSVTSGVVTNTQDVTNEVWPRQ